MPYTSETRAPLGGTRRPDESIHTSTSPAELTAARESERKHLARELHDELGAHLTAFRYVFARLERWLPLADPACEATLATAHQAYDALCEASQRVIADLHPPGIEAGLIAILAQWLDTFSVQTGLATSLVCAADPRVTQLTAQATTTLFRIAQEAVNNAAKHAKSTRIDVRITADSRHLNLVVTDNGQGFAATAQARAGHFGIAGMRERCRNFGGVLKISSKRNLATIVLARLPWQTLLRPPA
jgi:signal transduction histidine kinase